MDVEQREFRADPMKLKRLRVAAGFTVQEFAKEAGLDRTTAAKILRGQPVFLTSLALACQKAFSIVNPLEVLHPDELCALGIPTEIPSPNQVLEWEIEEYLTGWAKTSNGLQFQQLRLRHRFLEHRLSRAKCYELRHLTPTDRERLEGYLRRHVDVCEQIGSHPNITQNLSAAWVGGLWWVFDQWEAGCTLARRLVDGPLGDYELRYIMTGIAQGLIALHEQGIIRRELTPEFVFLREKNDSPILTDLELAKLTEGNPTVSPTDWPADPYRAIEVGGDSPIDQRADIYSWGRIFIRAATGSLPEPGDEKLNDSIVPKKVQNLVMQCVEIPRSKRPAELQTVLAALKAWP